MSQPRPARVLGNGQSDNPYEPRRSSVSRAPEITSLDDPAPAPVTIPVSAVEAQSESAEEAPTETTALLAAPTTKPPAVGRTPSSASRSTSNVESGAGGRSRRRPWRLKLSFLFACVLLYVNFSFLILTISAITSPFIAHNALPPHRGSNFLPIWLSALSLVTNVLCLIAFIAPNESPKLASWTNLVGAGSCLVQLIVILAVGQLRHRESVLTLVLIGVALASTLHAAASALLVERFAPLLVDPPPRPTRQAMGFGASLKRVASAILGFLSISLPLALLHIAIALAFSLLLLSVIFRAYDASLEPAGQLWKVNPWNRRYGGGRGNTGVSDLNGRPYTIHLACRGVEVDPIIASAEDPQWAFEASNATATTSDADSLVKKVRRTILIETDRGIPGQIGSDWVMQMLKEGALTSPDTDVRVCWWDRPGYGFSDNSPSASTGHLMSALTEALHLSGEMARIEAVTTATSLPPPSPLAKSGFVLVSTGYGALSTTLFATLHAPLIHSILYLSPEPPAFHFSPRDHALTRGFKFFFVNGLGAWSTELGLWRLWVTLKGSSRSDRVLSTERAAIRGEIERSFLQEESESRNPASKSARAWKNARTRYPVRPTIVLSGASDKEAWENDFVKAVVGEGLKRWDQDWSGKCGSADGSSCRKALLELVRMD